MSAFPIQCNVKHATGARKALARRQFTEPLTPEKRTDVEAMTGMTNYAERPEAHVRHSSADSCTANNRGSNSPFQHPHRAMHDLKLVESVQQTFQEPFTFWRSMSVDHRNVHAAIHRPRALSPPNTVTHDNGAARAIKSTLKPTNGSPLPGSDSFDVNSNVFLNKFRSTTFVPA